MYMVETRVLKDPSDVHTRLAELALQLDPLLNVASEAIGAGREATPFHPANAEGMLRYQTGVWALRYRHVGKEWCVDRQGFS